MPRFKGLKESLDWVAHGKLVFELVVAIASARWSKAMLVSWGKISPIWISPIEWTIAALILALFLYFWRGRKSIAQSDVPSVSTALAKTTPNTRGNFDSAEMFRLAYYSVLQSEAEKSFKTEAERVSPEDKETFYLKVLGIGLVSVVYDQIWWPLFRSQLLALLKLNKENGILPIDTFRKFYEEAARENPAHYTTRTFDDWMKYLIDNGLLIAHPSNMIEITVRGKDFLKYLLHWGRSEDTKKL